jgi:hypothetical protein
VGVLLGGGGIISALAIAAMIGLAAWDWARLRKSDRTPAEVADRLGLDLFALSVILVLEMIAGLL